MICFDNVVEIRNLNHLNAKLTLPSFKTFSDQFFVFDIEFFASGLDTFEIFPIPPIVFNALVAPMQIKFLTVGAAIQVDD